MVRLCEPDIPADVLARVDKGDLALTVFSRLKRQPPSTMQAIVDASTIVEKVWSAAKVVGMGSYFPDEDGGMIVDDHGPINQNRGIPTIDIIPYYPDCEQSNFGPTWHTVSDDMAHIDRNTLKAVGQTLIQVLYSE